MGKKQGRPVFPGKMHFLPPAKRPRTDRELSDLIFELANRGLPRTDFLEKVSSLLIRFFECDATELWLEESGVQARCSVSRRPAKSFHFRLVRGVRKKGGKVIPVHQSDSPLEAFGWDVLLGKVDPGNPSCLRKDVFWIFDSGPGESGAGPEGPRPGDPYRSLALTPLRVGSKRTALLMLSSLEEGFFARRDLAPLGRVAQNLGLALMNQGVQAALQERIKELTCLYTVSRVMEDPQRSLGDVLQSVVEALPAAWQYPHLASARILLDNRSYPTPHFHESRYRQAADLIVNGRARGSVEVVYGGEKPDLYEGPFLQEERRLIDTVARRNVARSVEQLRKLSATLDRLIREGRIASRATTWTEPKAY